jgi:hypothetical protein
MDANQLVHEVVQLLQSALNYYYAHIYILDEEQGQLTVRWAARASRADMLERDHRIRVGKAWWARQPRPRRCSCDVHLDPNWLANPLLPETR